MFFYVSKYISHTWISLCYYASGGRWVAESVVEDNNKINGDIKDGRVITKTTNDYIRFSIY